MNIQTTPEVMEALFTGLLQNGVKLVDILSGLQNACADGTHIDGVTGVCDPDLKAFLQGLDEAMEAAQKI